MSKKNFLALFFFSIISFFIFWKIFLVGLYPFPGNFLLAWYEPWKSENFINGNILISHKPVAEDIFRQIYPFKTLAIDIFKKGEFPLWNPYNGSGMPLLATSNIGFLDPFNILFFIFPYYLASSLYIFIQPILIGFFTYLYCRKISLSFSSSIFSAIVFMFSGLVMVRLIYGMYGLAIATIPLSLFLIESYIKNKNTKKIFLLPFVIFSTIISTQPQITLYIFMFIFIYLIYRLIQKREKKDFQLSNSILPIVLIVLGIGISSIQLFPTFELYKNANINAQSSAFIFERFLLPVKHLITILIPNYFGDIATYNYWGYSDYIQTNIYFGIIPVFFAFIGLTAKLSKHTPRLQKFFFIIIILTILSCLDWIGAKILFSLSLPLISTGIPSRIFVITTFCIVILAGFGFEKLFVKNVFTESKYLLKKMFLFCLLIFLLILYTLFNNPSEIPCLNGIIQNCRNIALRNTLLETIPFLGFVLSIIVLLLFKNKTIIKLSKFVGLLIIIVLGLYNSYKFLPFSSKDKFLPQDALIKNILDETDINRTFGLGQANIQTNFATYFRFYDPQYYHPLYIKSYGEFINYANRKNSKEGLKRSDVEITSDLNIDKEQKLRRERLFAILGVKYLIFKKSETAKQYGDNIFWENDIWYIKINNQALPRTYLINNFEVIKNRETTLKKLFDPNFNPDQEIILEEKPSLIPENNQKVNSFAEIKDYQENKLTIETNSNSNCLLFISDNYYPGWKAYVDDKEVKIYRANYTFRAVEVPKGSHLVKFSYEPKSLKIGIIISLLSLLILSTMIIFWQKLNIYSQFKKFSK